MEYESLRTFIELQSLALTAPVLVLCAFVVFECVKPLRGSKRNTQMRWILLGICTGFLGNLVDNLYWMIPWTANYLGLSCTAALVNFGVFPNVFFRQFLTSVAAYCHLKAFIPDGHPRLHSLVNWAVVVSVVMGQGYIFVLWSINKGLFYE